MPTIQTTCSPSYTTITSIPTYTRVRYNGYDYITTSTTPYAEYNIETGTITAVDHGNFRDVWRQYDDYNENLYDMNWWKDLMKTIDDNDCNIEPLDHVEKLFE